MFFKAFVYMFTFIFVFAFKALGWIVSGLGALIASACQAGERRKQEKIAQADADRMFEVSREKGELEAAHTEAKINSLKNQMEAEFQLADAYRKKALTEADGVKRAELRRKAAQADARADAILDKIYKLQGR